MPTFSSLFFFFFLLLHTTLINASPQNDCRIKRPKAYAAIEKFCSRDSIQVHSAYADAGQWDPAHKARAAIKGTCFPSQWVPIFYCKVQFWDMCAGKVRKRRYGRNSCQIWTIQYDGDFVIDYFPDRWHKMLRRVRDGGEEGLIGGRKEEEVVEVKDDEEDIIVEEEEE